MLVLEKRYCFGIFQANPSRSLEVLASDTKTNNNQNYLIENVKDLQLADNNRPANTYSAGSPYTHMYTVPIPGTSVVYKVMPIGDCLLVFTRRDGSAEFSTRPVYVLACTYKDAGDAIFRYNEYIAQTLKTFPIKFENSGLVVGAPFTHTGQIAAFLWMKATSAPDGTMAVVHGQRIYNCRDSAGAVIIRCYSPDGQKICPPAYVVAHSVEAVRVAMRA